MIDNPEKDTRDWVIARMQHFELMLAAADKFNLERSDAVLAVVKANEVVVKELYAIALHDRERMFATLTSTFNAAMEAHRLAVSKAEAAVEKRFDAVNEFRAQLGDQSRTLMPRPEAEVLFKSLDTRIDAANAAAAELNTRLAAWRAEKSGGADGFKSGWGLALGAAAIITVILGIASFIMGLKH